MATASLWEGPRGGLTPVSLVSAFLDLGLSLPLSSTPPLSLPASPLASDLDLFLPWEAQGQSLGARGTCFVLGCVCLTPPPTTHGREAWTRLVPPWSRDASCENEV